MNNPIFIISSIFIASIACFVVPKRLKPFFALLVSAFALAGAVAMFRIKPAMWDILGHTAVFRVDNLAGFVAVFVAFFGFLILLYSITFMAEKDGEGLYYPYVLATIAASLGAVVSNDLILFSVFWGFLGITLYLLVSLGGEAAKAAAKKTFIIIGGSDSLMLLGITIIWKMTGSFAMDQAAIPLAGPAASYAFVLLALAAFAKAGAMPMHTWIPDCAEVAPLPVMAFLPASVDKLLGIYFLTRLSLDIFALKPDSAMSLFLLTIGAFTLIAAVMMALVQRTMKKLLSYNTVSQVGYMLLGIGTATPIGIAGGIFHMLNHAVYECMLFFTTGAVEKKANTTELDSLGGIAHFMPVSFLCCLVGSLAISGVPPFNGFVSKWMVYQGIVELGKSGGKLWVIWLIAAMFGSALTLACFMKLLHAVFLGQGPISKESRIGEVPASMWLPMVVLAALCIIFGIFAFSVPVKYFIAPSLKSAIAYSGLWQPGIATILLLIGLAVGAVVYLLGTAKASRTVEPFVGGGMFPVEERPTGAEFYNTIAEFPVINTIYRKAQEGFFDVYEAARKATFGISGVLQYLHNGVLLTYLAWCLIGMLLLFLILMV